MVVLLVLLFVLIAIGYSWIRGMQRYKALSASPIVLQKAYQMKLDSFDSPAGIYFSPTHSWAHLQPSGSAKVGIDAFIQHLTGVLSAVGVPEVGAQVRQGDPLFNVIHKGKELTISSPISGRIRAVNTEALENMRLLKREPYDGGWLCEIEPSNWHENISYLLLGEKTISWLKTEMSRLRDFFARTFTPADGQVGQVLLQDGGDVAESALAFAEKKIWRLFQAEFLDVSNKELLGKA